MKEIPENCISVSAGAVAKAWHYASKEDTRKALHGVHLRPCAGGGVNVIATDGRCAFFHFDAIGTAPGPLTLQISKAFAKTCERLKMNRIVVSGGRLCIRDHTGIEMAVQPGAALHDAEYPDVRKIIPDLKEYRIGLNADINPHFAFKAAKALGKMYRLYSHKDGGIKPVIAHATDLDEACVLIMPMQHGAIPASIHTLDKAAAA